MTAWPLAMSSYLTRHTFGQMWVWQATHASDASFLTPDTYAVLNQAALNACDATDGLKDGIIGDPEGCRVDLATVQCNGAPAANCLTPPQVEAARKIYLGPRHSRTGAELYSPLYPGSEPGWGQLGRHRTARYSSRILQGGRSITTATSHPRIAPRSNR